MKTTNAQFAVCEFYKDGTVFPVQIAIQTEAQAASAKHWMQIGAGQFEDWRVIAMTELRRLLEAGKVDLHIFTPEAQAEKRAIILNA